MADLDQAQAAEIHRLVNTNGNEITINADGSINVVTGGGSSVSTNNSSSTPLGISGVFTGTSEDVKNTSVVTIAVFADQASATDGLSIEFSTDGTNWDHTTKFTIPANTGKIFTVQRTAQFFRIVYTNGTTAQGTFRLQSILNSQNTKGSTHRIQDTISDDEDSELVKSILAGEDPNDVFRNIQVTTGGRLLVSQEPGPTDTTVNDYDRQNVGSHPTTLINRTVGAGKVIDIENWGLQTENAICLVVLKVAGIEVSSVRFSNSADTNIVTVPFGVNSPLRATAGQVITIETVSGDTGKDFTSYLNAVEKDV